MTQNINSLSRLASSNINFMGESKPLLQQQQANLVKLGFQKGFNIVGGQQTTTTLPGGVQKTMGKHQGHDFYTKQKSSSVGACSSQNPGVASSVTSSGHFKKKESLLNYDSNLNSTNLITKDLSALHIKNMAGPHNKLMVGPSTGDHSKSNSVANAGSLLKSGKQQPSQPSKKQQ